MVRYFSAVLIQATGPALMLLLTLLLANELGPVEQGNFLAAKSVFDLLISICIFGFPQSIILEINRNNASRAQLHRYAVRYSLLAVGVTLTLTSIMNTPLIEGLRSMVFLSIGSACVVLAALWRAILITVTDGYRYHLVTTAPTLSLSLVASLYVLLEVNISRNLGPVFLLGGILTLVMTYGVAKPTRLFDESGLTPSLRGLASNGTDAFLLSIAVAGQIYVTYAYLKHEAPPEIAGYFGLAVTVSNMLSFPLQALAPILLNRWSSAKPTLTAINSPKSKTFIAIAAVVAIGIALGVCFTPNVITAGLGKTYVGATYAVQAMIIVSLVSMLQKMGGLKLTASGYIRYNSFVSLGKFAFLLTILQVLTYFSAHVHDWALAAAITWLVAETAALLLTFRKLRLIRLW